MDLNELFSRHQKALMDMTNLACPTSRGWAEKCANYYAGRIETEQLRSGAAMAPGSHSALKRAVRGR